MLKQDIEQKIKEALKSGDKELLETLRFLLSSINNFEIEKRGEISDDDVISVVKKQVKQHRESIEAFTNANRPELAEKEQRQLDILLSYLPQQMSYDEIKVVVKESFDTMLECDKTNFGKIMATVMPKLKGRAEGNMISQAVKELLVWIIEVRSVKLEMKYEVGSEKPR